MDIRAGGGYPASALSNFAPHEFYFRGYRVASMEGLLQSLKFKKPHMQIHVMTLVGRAAKEMGSHKDWQRDGKLWWMGKPMDRYGEEYQDFLDEAYEALFTQNDSARRALLETRDATLSHSLGKTRQKDTVLTQSEFCSRLMAVRRRLQKAEKSRKM